MAEHSSVRARAILKRLARFAMAARHIMEIAHVMPVPLFLMRQIGGVGATDLRVCRH